MTVVTTEDFLISFYGFMSSETLRTPFKYTDGQTNYLSDQKHHTCQTVTITVIRGLSI
jgi:hypothetical protein